MTTFKKFNRLTEDEFVLLKGTERMSTMISNKWFCDDRVVDFLAENAVGQWCAIRHREGFIVYLESPHDIMQARQFADPDNVSAPPIHSINIVDEY